MAGSNQIAYCPLMSAGNEISVVCTQERCAWFMKNYKMCAMYILAHNAALDIKAKQNKEA